MEFDGECYKHSKYTEGVTSLSDNSETLLELFFNQCKRTPDKNVYGVIADEEIQWITYSDALKEVLHLYTFLRKEIERGSIIGIYSVNRYEWLVCEHAIYALGCVSCPLYSTYGLGAIVHILNQTEMETCFVSGRKAESLYEDILKHKKPSLKRIIVFDAFEHEKEYEDLGIQVHHFKDIVTKLGPDARFLERLVKNNKRKARKSDLATICYTSGTSGVPKGVMLTHTNFIASIAAFFRHTKSRSFYRVTENDVYISYLPLSHAMERICVHTLLSKGAAIGFYRGVVKELAKDYKIIRPTFIAGVPRVFNLFKDRILEQVGKRNAFQKAVFNFGLRWKYLWQYFGMYTSVLDYFIFKKVKREFGGRIRACLSGSAPLNRDVVKFLQATLSCKIFQGYGQTETTAASIVTPMEETTIDTVGVPFPSNKIKLVDLGEDYDNNCEIWVKGDNVFQGYFKNEEETKKCFEDGWFKSGDMGAVKNGLFQIVGRKKEIFKTSQGEYIVPEKIESTLQCPEVDDVLVSGKSDTDYIVAIVVCTKELGDSFVRNIIWAHAEKAVAKKEMMKFEVPKKILVLRESFAALGDFITPTGKKKRGELEKALKSRIEKLYATN